MSTYHEAHFTQDPARQVVWRAIARYLAPCVPPGAHVLELGAGYCHWINNVAAERRVAVDAWPDLASHAVPGVEALVLDVSAGLDALRASPFDVVLASNFLEHFEPDAAAAVVRDVAALLRPGGRFIVIQPNARFASWRYFDDYTHRAVFTDVSLPAMLRATGLATERVVPKFLPYSMRQTRLPITEWLVRAYLRSPLKPGAGQMLVIARKE